MRKYTEIVSRVHEIMQRKGLTQRELASRMGKNPSELSRWLKGEHNLTLRSLAKLEAELGEEIILVHDATKASIDLPKQDVDLGSVAARSVSDTVWTHLQVAASSSSKVTETCIA